ncbi:aldehyde dehydrogenase [Alphaproteobacteria bacterium]|nr:aldehyde dehydrogenase [Alphaproteobacteria bacterium]
MRYFSHFINGKTVEPQNNDWIDSINPTTGEIWARFARGNEADVDRAVNAAHEAYKKPEWNAASETRCKVLHAIADRIDQNYEQLVEVEVNDNGKRIREVNGQMSTLGGWYRHFAIELEKLEADRLSLDMKDISARLELMPYGVVAAITAWNSPLMIAAWKVAPALAAGNAVIIKPSEMASASTVVFAELIASVLPAGLVNVITGLGNEAGAALVAAEKVRKVTFTGSEIGGAKVAGVAAEHVKSTTLELGGKSPQLVFADADLESAVNGVMSGIFLSNGQTCVAGSRLIIHQSIKNEFMDKLLKQVAKLKFGDPMDYHTDIGPIANKPQFEKVLKMISDALDAGATAVTGGHVQSVDGFDNGYFIAPTILENVHVTDKIWQEEVFGPVLCVTSFDTAEEAVSLANDNAYGLAAGVWTSDIAFANYIASQIDAGTVYINHYRSVSAGAPIGGVKKSGYGRELGPNAIKDFMQEKAVWIGEKSTPDPFEPIT